MTQHFQQLLTISLGGLLCLNLGAVPSLAEASTHSDCVPVQGLPGRRLGGGTRNPKGYIEQMPLIALIPETNLGITIATHPRFLFYLPAANEAREIEFVLYNQADELVYEKTAYVTSTSGIFSIDLAEAEGLAPLQLDENYYWYFSIIAEDRAQDISVDGWTRRVELSSWIQTQSLAPDVALRLNTAPPLEQARILYQEAQLWHDAAVILEDLLQRDPNNQSVDETWNHLLQVVNLDELGSEPTNQVSVINMKDTIHFSNWVD